MSAFIDLALADKLLKPFPHSGDDEKAFISYMAAAMRNGHLCVEVTPEGLKPDPFLVDMGMELMPAIQRGAEKIPKELFTGQRHPLYKEENRFYFQRYWEAEKQCLRLFQQLMQSAPSLKIDVTECEEELLPEQARAIKQAAKNTLTLICGGPGTGKTYTIGYLLKHFRKSQSLRIALAAPTGKAAVHLENSLGKSYKVTTLHALLGIREGKNEKPNPLSADLVIVDECSMIDLKVMTALLAAIKPGARLILVGDPHQLSPVESGSLFADLVAYCKRLPDNPPAELKQCLRTDLQSIVQLAASIRSGEADRVLEMLQTDSLEGITYHPIEENVQKQLVEAVLSSSQNSFRLLSPLRKGPLGVDTLNRLCASQMQSESAPIILTRSDRRLGLFNGEMAVLVREKEHEEYALFEGSRRISRFLLPPYEYAYCLSVYKSQGSEFDEVWIVLPPGSECFGREVLYTAVTRARKKVHIWGSQEVIRETITRRAHRLSGISKID